MIYLEHTPVKPLNRFIESIWYCRADDLNSSNLTIPLVNHELVINFSENYRLTKADESSFRLENPMAWINGLQSNAYYSRSAGKHEMIGVLFKPTGLRAFTRFSSREFANDFVDPELIFGKPFLVVVERIREASEILEKILLVESFFIDQLKEGSSPSYLSDSVRRLSEAFAVKGSVKALCNEISITNKSLISTFNKYVGINPRKYSHLNVVNRAISMLSREPHQSLTSLTYELDFFDQAHFTKMFKSVTSLTPSQYSALVSENKVELGSPNFITLKG